MVANPSEEVKFEQRLNEAQDMFVISGKSISGKGTVNSGGYIYKWKEL